MNKVIETMLASYQCQNLEDYEQALKEIIQEIALAGMWRAKFFEVGAFYGGTALRILYGLDRFSEDLDFSLLEKNSSFDLAYYEGYLIRELNSFNFDVVVEKKQKNIITPIQSAFIKANTMTHLLKIHSNLKTHRDKVIKIKLEVDTSPPLDYKIAIKTLRQPFPFSVKTFSLPTLFAGKISAALYRPYQINTKGRDWYDVFWYISHHVPLDLKHLKARLVQIEKWDQKDDLKLQDIQFLLQDKINQLNIESAIKDVRSFVTSSSYVDSWNKELFLDLCSMIQAE